MFMPFPPGRYAASFHPEAAQWRMRSQIFLELATVDFAALSVVSDRRRAIARDIAQM
jgi:hypothetical protein